MVGRYFAYAVVLIEIVPLSKLIWEWRGGGEPSIDNQSNIFSYVSSAMRIIGGSKS